MTFSSRPDAMAPFGTSATARFSGSFRLMKPGNGRRCICHMVILEMPFSVQALLCDGL